MAGPAQSKAFLQSSTLGRRALAARLAVLAVLFSAGAILEVRSTSSVLDGDIWWHLRSGLWMLQNHHWPRTALFTQQSELPWALSSWGFDLLLAVAYRLIGLATIPLLIMLFRFAFAVLTFLLAGGRRGSFWPAVLLSALAQYCMGAVAPGPMLVSILFFGVELLLLVQARSTLRFGILYGLPALFALWANLDCGFVAGLLLLVIFLAALLVENLLQGKNSREALLAMRPALTAAALCPFAALITPYSYHQYANFFSGLYAKAAIAYLPELQAFGFRNSRDYVLILFVFSAFFVLGRKRGRDLFPLFILLITTPILFRIQRDAWLAVLPAAAGFGNAGQAEDHALTKVGSPSWLSGVLLLSSLLAFVAVLVAALRLPAPEELQRRMARKFPVRACEFIRQNHPPAPLFNLPEWGGFLIFALPEYPVATDNRISLYGNEQYTQIQLLSHGDLKLEEVPVFSNARTIVLDRRSAMARALVNLPALSMRYRVLYQDDLAVVFQAL